MYAIPNIGRVIAKQIVRKRQEEGNLSLETLELMPRLRLTQQAKDMISFRINPDLKMPDDDQEFVDRMSAVIEERQTQTKSYPDAPPPQDEDNREPFNRQLRSERGENWDSDIEFNSNATQSYPRLPINRPTSESRHFRPTTLPQNLAYDGNSSWPLFRNKFVQYADASHWSDRERQLALCWSLTGKAGAYYTLMTEMNADISFRQMMIKLDKRFNSTEQPETLQAKFNQLFQDQSETIQDWADRVLSLATRVFKDLPEQHITRQAIMRFCIGYKNKEAGQHACATKPRTLEMAVEAIEWYECIHQAVYGKDHSYDHRAPNEVSDRQMYSQGTTVAAQVKTEWNNWSQGSRDPRRAMHGDEIQDLNKEVKKLSKHDSEQDQKIDQVMEQIKALNAKMDKLADQVLKFTLRSRSQSPGQNRPTSRRDRSVSPRRDGCFHCGESGHFKRDCPKTKQVTFEDLNEERLDMGANVQLN